MRHAMVLILLVVAACGGGVAGIDATSSSTGPPDGGLDAFGDGVWRLVTADVDGTALQPIAAHPVTVTLTEDGLGGTAACNSHFASLSVSDEVLNVGEIGATAMECMDDAVMALESAFLVALSRVTADRMAEGRLLLTGDGVEMAFSTEVPTPTAELEGADWILDALISTDTVSSAVSGTTATLVGSAGSLSGSTGCNSLSGTVGIVDGRLIGGGIATAELACDEGRMAQEAHVLAVLGANPIVTIEGEALTLTADDGRGLVYRVG